MKPGWGCRFERLWYWVRFGWQGSDDTLGQLLGQYCECTVTALILHASQPEHIWVQHIAFKVACLIVILWGVRFSFSGDGVGPLRYFYLVFVRAVVGVCVGAARPCPVQLYYSVDLHSKLYMLVFTFCFSNKIPWSTLASVCFLNCFFFFLGWGQDVSDSAVILVEYADTGRHWFSS